MPNTTTRQGMTVTSYTVKETAAEMRKALRAAFPATKFSVRMARGSAHGWMDVSWVDGPTEAQVRPVVEGFQDERFNGMTDSYDRVEPTLYAVDGEDLPVLVEFNCSGVCTSRSFTEAAQQWADTEVAKSYPEPSQTWDWYSIEIDDQYIGGETYGTDSLSRMVLASLDLTNRF